MRIAVLSDVHGNLRALEAVTDDLRRQAPDLVVHGGDLALNGPRPAEVVDHIRELGWPGARGNADELLWAGLDPVPAAEREFAQALRQATLRLLGPDRVQWLRQLPRLWRHEDLVVMHASPTTVEEAPPVEATDRQLVETYGGLAGRRRLASVVSADRRWGGAGSAGALRRADPDRRATGLDLSIAELAGQGASAGRIRSTPGTGRADR
jgi:3',5'-cyclic AMP phosphodiesterase CpdA